MRARRCLMNLIIVLLTVAVATVCAAADVYEQTLKEENDSLRWQLDSYRNEVELLRKEQIRNSRGDDEQALGQTNGPDVHIQLLQQSLHSVQQVGPSPRHSGLTKYTKINFKQLS